MVLNRNPDNFFHENEQLAFCPSMIVPGGSAAALELLLVYVSYEFLCNECVI